MDKVLTNAQMRECDNYTINTLGVLSEVLMRRAGLAVADEVEKAALKFGAESVLVVCGTGNNGGDGYVCAEELRNRGVNVSVYAFVGKLSADCQREKAAYKGRYSQHICGAIIVDCIFGTGLTRKVEGEYAEIIEKINASGAYIISADMPSGLNGDNGLILGYAVKASLTVAIAEFKTGMFLNDGLDCCGRIIKKDVGITCPQDNYCGIYGEDDLAKFFPSRRRNSNKGTYGRAELVAGSKKYPGAALLAVRGALKSGCGYVKLTTDESLKFHFAARYPQVIFPDKCDVTAEAIAVGSGCGVSGELYAQIINLLENYSGILIIDADGLNSLAEYGVEVLLRKKCAVILTPHVKEFSRLAKMSVEEIASDPVSAATSFAKKYGVIVVLKSSATVISDGKRTALNIRGTTALSKGGSGDVLCGFMCGTAARGVEAFSSAVVAANVLGIAAEISSEEKTDYCAAADDVIKNLHSAVKRLTQKT